NRLDTGERSTLSASDGAYTFDNLAPGNYLIGLVPKPGWRQTFPSAPPVGAALVSNGSTLSDAMQSGVYLARQYDPAMLDSAEGWVVGLSPNTTINSVLSKTGATTAAPINSLPNGYTLAFPASMTGSQTATRI